MSILEEITYKKFSNRTAPSWFTAERYEYCESFYDESDEKKSGMISRLAAMIVSVF